MNQGKWVEPEDQASRALSLRFRQAACRGDLQGLRDMLAVGQCVQSVDGEGRSALMMAAQGGQLDALDLLLNAGADHMHASNMPPFTALHWALNAAESQSALLLARRCPDLLFEKAAPRVFALAHMADRQGREGLALALLDAMMSSRGFEQARLVFGDRYRGVFDRLHSAWEQRAIQAGAQVARPSAGGPSRV